MQVMLYDALSRPDIGFPCYYMIKPIGLHLSRGLKEPHVKLTLIMGHDISCVGPLCNIATGNLVVYGQKA